MIVGLVAFGTVNGATRIALGIHLDRVPFTARSTRDHRPDEVLLTGPAGSTYIFAGACLHSGAADVSPVERGGSTGHVHVLIKLVLAKDVAYQSPERTKPDTASVTDVWRGIVVFLKGRYGALEAHRGRLARQSC